MKKRRLPRLRPAVHRGGALSRLRRPLRQRLSLRSGARQAAARKAAATHAWAEVYLPGAGWIEYDPTDVMFAGENLIRVAVTRDPSQAMPISLMVHVTGRRERSLACPCRRSKGHGKMPQRQRAGPNCSFFVSRHQSGSGCIEIFITRPATCDKPCRNRGPPGPDDGWRSKIYERRQHLTILAVKASG